MQNFTKLFIIHHDVSSSPSSATHRTPEWRSFYANSEALTMVSNVPVKLHFQIKPIPSEWVSVMVPFGGRIVLKFQLRKSIHCLII